MIIIQILAVSGIYAQEGGEEMSFSQPGFNPMYIGSGIGNTYPSQSSSSDKKLDVGVQLGTSFATDFNRGFAFSTFVAPELRYRVSDRFRIRGGVQVSNNEYANSMFYTPYGFANYTGNITQGLLYVSGDYMISTKVILSGTAFKEFSIDHTSPDNAFRPGYDGKGVMMNLRFMPSENVFIDVGAEFYQGNNPWRGGSYSPFNSPMRPYW